MKDIQNLINNNINSLCKDFTKPQKKAVKETINGVIRHESCVLQKIFSDTKNEKISKKAENSRNQLNQINLSEKVNDFLIKRTVSQIEKDTVIAFDEGEIAKPKSKKMESISRIWDASQKRRCAGYDLCGMSTKDTFLQLEIWNKKTEKISEIRRRMILNVTKKTKKNGIFVFDRGHDHTQLIKQMMESSLRFVIRAKNLRSPFDNMLQKKRKITEFDLGYHSISIKEKNGKWTGDLFLVVTKRKNKSGELEHAFFLTNLSPQHYSVQSIKNFYHQRWDIEKHYQQIKSHYGLESIRLKSILVIKNLLAICTFALWVSAKSHKKITKLKAQFNIYFAVSSWNFKRFCKRFGLSPSSVSAFRSFLSKKLPVFISQTGSRPSRPTLFSYPFLNSGVF